jgi:protein-L-isoaspartate(D-aspartate) O-methyltransferase
MNNTQLARHHMIDGQLEPNRVLRPEVIAAMGVTPRERFVPASYRQCAYIDEDIPLGHGRFMMQPMTLAQLIQALDVKPGDKALVVAGNTGYSAVILAQLGAKVTVVEEQRELADFSRQALAEMGFDTIKVQTSALYNGCSAAAPFDVILIDGAVEAVPAKLLEQLAEGGRLATVESNANPMSLVAGMGRSVLWRKEKGLLNKRIMDDASVPVIASFVTEKRFTL